MSCPFTTEQLAQLKGFVQLCTAQPEILHHPSLSFFKDYLLSFGVKLPAARAAPKNQSSGDNESPPTSKPQEAEPAVNSEDEMEPESDVELDMEGVIEADSPDNTQEMGDESKEPTDEERDESDEKRTSAMQAFSEQNYNDAIKFYTEAIKLNPQSALLFAKRGQVYLKMNKPNACIKDCSKALALNCDSAAAYKFRGRAYRLLGKFEEASQDLCESLKIDYDDQTNEWLAEVKPNAEKLRQHKVTWQRKMEEKEHRDRVRRARNAQEARAAAAREQAAREQAAPPRGVPPGMEFMFDPEMQSAFKDPELLNALIDVTSNPANIVKYQNNPKILEALAKIQSKMPNMGMGGGGMGGMPFNFAGADAGAGVGAGSAPPTADDDVGLD